MRGSSCLVLLALGVAVLGCPSLSSLEPGGAPADASPTDATIDSASPDSGADTADGACGALPLTSDPANCGTCGHDCLGGGCKDGACQPMLLASLAGSPYGLAADSTSLFWVDGTDSRIAKCVADDCASTVKVLVSLEPIPQGIAVDATNVYWANYGYVDDAGWSGGVDTCGLAGCANGVSTVLVTGQAGAARVRVDSTFIYWTTVVEGAVRKCTIGNCGTTTTTLASAQGGPVGLAVDATSLYWANVNTNTVMKCALPGCTSPVTLASNQFYLGDLLLAGGGLYWSAGNLNDMGIRRCDVAGCAGAPTPVASGLASTQYLAADDTSVYWTVDANPGSVMSCPLAGCAGAPKLLAIGQNIPSGIVVGPRAIYWVNAGDPTNSNGSVMKVAK